MPSQAEKNRRKALVHEITQRKRKAEEARMPLSRTELSALFNYLDQALVEGCDHSLRLTRKFLGAHSIPEDAVIPWLGEYGGYCDCEVLANVEDAWPGET